MKTTMSTENLGLRERNSLITFIGISKSTINFIEFDDYQKDGVKAPIDLIICTIVTSPFEQPSNLQLASKMMKDYLKRYNQDIIGNKIKLRVFESDETEITDDKIVITDKALNATTTILLKK